MRAKGTRVAEDSLRYYLESRIKYLQMAVEELRKMTSSIAVETQILIYNNELDTLLGIKSICERRGRY